MRCERVTARAGNGVGGIGVGVGHQKIHQHHQDHIISFYNMVILKTSRVSERTASPAMVTWRAGLILVMQFAAETTGASPTAETNGMPSTCGEWSEPFDLGGSLPPYKSLTRQRLWEDHSQSATAIPLMPIAAQKAQTCKAPGGWTGVRIGPFPFFGAMLGHDVLVEGLFHEELATGALISGMCVFMTSNEPGDLMGSKFVELPPIHMHHLNSYEGGFIDVDVSPTPTWLDFVGDGQCIPAHGGPTANGCHCRFLDEGYGFRSTTFSFDAFLEDVRETRRTKADLHANLLIAARFSTGVRPAGSMLSNTWGPNPATATPGGFSVPLVGQRAAIWYPLRMPYDGKLVGPVVWHSHRGLNSQRSWLLRGAPHTLGLPRAGHQTWALTRAPHKNGASTYGRQAASS